MKIKNVIKTMVLLFIGGTIYYYIECAWRGYSHIAMFFVGGICFVQIGAINEFFPWDLSIIKQSIIGACLVTIIELLSGMVLNVWLCLDIWDYSNLPFNIYGQICLPFFFAWMVLSCVAIVIDDYLRYWLFDEEKPHYVLFEHHQNL